MKIKQNPEGVIIENAFNDESTIAQRQLKKCKEMEREKKLISVPFGKNTLYLVQEGTDIEEWKKRKEEALSRHRNCDF